MKYVTLIYPKPGSHDLPDPEQQAALTAEYIGLRRDPRCIGGGHLQPSETATTVRENLVTDGPFADTKEILAGYYVLDADNLDEALEFTQKIPALRLGGAVEVRPLVDIPGETGF